MGAEAILKPNHHFYSITELLAAGLTYYRINKLVANGQLVKLNNKMYENMSYEGEESDFAYVKAYAPKGVVCMMSAARHYGLTTYLPEGVDIAIERNMKISTIPDWPQVNMWFFPEKRYTAGVTSSSDGVCEFQIEIVQRRRFRVPLGHIQVFKYGLGPAGRSFHPPAFRNAMALDGERDL